MTIVDNKMLREPNLLTTGKKPVGNVEVDWDNPLARDLADCVMSVNCTPPVQLGREDREILIPDNIYLKPATYQDVGEATTNNGVSKNNLPDQYDWIDLNPVESTKFTAIVSGIRYSTPPAQHIAYQVGARDSGGDGDGFEINYGNAYGDANAIYVDTVGASDLKVSINGYSYTGNNPVTGISVENNTLYTLGFSVSSFNIGDYHRLLAKRTTTINRVWCHDSGFFIYLTFNRELSENELNLLTADPYQILKPA